MRLRVLRGPTRLHCRDGRDRTFDDDCDNSDQNAQHCISVRSSSEELEDTRGW